jgi:hypothetical protein
MESAKIAMETRPFLYASFVQLKLSPLLLRSQSKASAVKDLCEARFPGQAMTHCMYV